MSDGIQSQGGKARAAKLTPEQRSEIAKKASSARWSVKALYEGEVQVSEDISIPCAVLEDGTRLLTQQGFLKAIGRARSAKGGQGSTVEGVIPFLAAKNLQPFVSDELRAAAVPVEFRTDKGTKAYGFHAELLPQVSEVYLSARDAGVLHSSQLAVAKACDIVTRGLARVGIIALVDEATGYQEIRDRDALQAILKKYVDGKLYEWTKTFPTEFFKEIFRLKEWEWNAGKMPGVVGKYINDLIYDRITPDLLIELKKQNPKNDRGNRRYRHHQLLSRDLGHPELTLRINQILGMAYACENWDQFYFSVQRKFPKQGSTLMMDFGGQLNGPQSERS